MDGLSCCGNEQPRELAKSLRAFWITALDPTFQIQSWGKTLQLKTLAFPGCFIL